MKGQWSCRAEHAHAYSAPQQFASSDRVKNALGFSASSWSLSSLSNLTRTAELPAWDEFDFPFQVVKHKCKDKKLNIEEKPGYETKTSRSVQTAH